MERTFGQFWQWCDGSRRAALQTVQCASVEIAEDFTTAWRGPGLCHWDNISFQFSTGNQDMHRLIRLCMIL